MCMCVYLCLCVCVFVCMNMCLSHVTLLPQGAYVMISAPCDKGSGYVRLLTRVYASVYML